MTWRAGRGAAGPGPRIEVLPPDEQPYTPAGAAAPVVTRTADGRVTDAASARALAKLPRRATYLPRDVVCAEGFAPHNRRRVEWLKARRNEFYATTGGVSHGVGAMLASAAWLYAGGEFAAERAASSGDAENFKIAASLTATARQHDLAAWEMAVREAEARLKIGGAVDPHAALLAGLSEEP